MFPNIYAANFQAVPLDANMNIPPNRHRDLPVLGLPGLWTLFKLKTAAPNL